MKPRLLFTLSPILLALFMLAGSNKAEGAVSISFGIGERHPYPYGGTVVQYRTPDPVYTTWYPDSSPTYVAPVYYTTPGPVYYAAPAPTYYTAPYVYRAPAPEFNVWFGSDGRRHYGRTERRR